jgi:murein DD-endopeptidase MepM/ murein hydrolase activator NlpD
LKELKRKAKQRYAELQDKYTELQDKWSRLNKRKVARVTALFLLAGSAITYFVQHPEILSEAGSAKISPIELGSFDRPDIKERNGIVYNYYDVVEGEIKRDEFLGVILNRHHVSTATVDRLAKLEKEVENRPVLNVGKKYTVLSNKESGKAEFFIYEPSPYTYYIYQIKDELKLTQYEREVTKQTSSSSGVITSSLWNAIVGNENIDPSMVFSMASNMEDAFQWTVDFHHVQKGDKFKLIFEEDWIEGERVGVGRLLAAEFNFDSKNYHAIRYKSENYDGFFDLEARPMVKTFLKAPVKYSRISSRYNPRRYHPVLKRTRAHLGTDFAAPKGTPIYATANGTVSKKGRTRGNGNYVKIKHDETYSTQYLHMSGFAKGVGKGSRVRQGDVIGYVGSTGLATGPHVCYRFWKHGKQVDPLKLNFPPPEPMNAQDKETFMQEKAVWFAQLEGIEYKVIEKKKPAVEEKSEGKKDSNP